MDCQEWCVGCRYLKREVECQQNNKISEAAAVALSRTNTVYEILKVDWESIPIENKSKLKNKARYFKGRISLIIWKYIVFLIS